MYQLLQAIKELFCFHRWYGSMGSKQESGYHWDKKVCQKCNKVRWTQDRRVKYY